MRPSGLHEHALDLLRDGQWHDYEQTLKRLMRVVPPHLAVHEAEESRRRNWLRNNPGKTVKDVPPRKRWTAIDQQVTFGSRLMARAILYNAAFQWAKNQEGKKVIRIFQADNPEPPPPGFTLMKHSGASRYYGMTPEQIAEEKRKIREKGRLSLLRNKGYDPATHISQRERTELRKARMARMTPEERHQYHSELSRKGWETRKKNQKESDG